MLGFGLEPLLQHLGHQFNSRQLLPQAIVQVLANAPLLPVADFQNFSLQSFALGDVPHEAGIYSPARQPHITHRQFQGENCAVHAPSHHFPANADDFCLPGVPVVRQIAVMLLQR